MSLYSYECIIGIDGASVNEVAIALADILGLAPSQLIPWGVGIVIRNDRVLDTQNWPLNGHRIRVLVNCTGEEEDNYDTGVYKGPRPGDADVVITCTAFNRTPDNWVPELSKHGIKCRLLSELRYDYGDAEFHELLEEARSTALFLLAEAKRTGEDNVWRLEPPNTPAGRPPDS